MYTEENYATCNCAFTRLNFPNCWYAVAATTSKLLSELTVVFQTVWLSSRAHIFTFNASRSGRSVYYVLAPCAKPNRYSSSTFITNWYALQGEEHRCGVPTPVSWSLKNPSAPLRRLPYWREVSVIADHIESIQNCPYNVALTLSRARDSNPWNIYNQRFLTITRIDILFPNFFFTNSINVFNQNHYRPVLKESVFILQI